MNWFGLVLVLMLGSSMAARAALPHGARRNAKHEIESLEEQWRTAQLAGDVPTMDRLLSDDFVGISMHGEANTKAQQLDRFRNRTLVLTSINLSDRKIKLVDSVAIVTSLAEVEGTSEGEQMKGKYRYTRIYQRLPSGIWKTTNFEVTRVPDRPSRSTY
jgi:ketosteroid isomerase-like protein